MNPQSFYLSQDAEYIKNQHDLIINNICKCLNVEKELIVGKSRKRYVLDAKKIAVSFIKKYCALTHYEIGLLFSMDHSSVTHSLKSYDALSSCDKSFKRKLKMVEMFLVLNKSIVE